MVVVVLGATGGTGRQLLEQALARNLEVRALVRDPAQAGLPSHPRLEIVRADVLEPATIAAAIAPDDVVVSGLGLRGKQDVGVLTAGASAVAAANPRQVIWLGAMGTGDSATAVSAPVRWLLKTGFGSEHGDKVGADSTILKAGGVVVHSGPLSDKPDNPDVGLAPIAEMPRQFFPAGAPRASIARLMLDLATRPEAAGLFAVNKSASKRSP